MRAIDVSAYQGKPDWSKVKKAGVSAAILRIANRKGKDESFEHNYAGCETAGIRRGVYRYSYAKSPAEAVREALGVLNILDNRPLELGVWLGSGMVRTACAWEKSDHCNRTGIYQNHYNSRL